MYKKLFNIIFKTQLKQHANDTHFSELASDIFFRTYIQMENLRYAQQYETSCALEGLMN